MTGQALATLAWAKHSGYHVESIDNNFEGMGLVRRICETLLLPYWIAIRVIAYKPVAMYLSVKRSKLGMLADLTCLAVYKLFAQGPVIAHLHGAELLRIRRFMVGRFLTRALMSRVSTFIVLSPKMSEQLVGVHPKRIRVIGNFSERFAASGCIDEKISAFANEPLRVLFMSNVIFTKGFVYLMDGVRMLRARGYQVSLTLAGRAIGDSAMSSTEVADELRRRLCDGIEYIGPVFGCAKWNLFERAHVVALPTFYDSEAQPISLIEGMAFGCIPLTTYHNYNQDFLDPRIAVFVEARSAVAIADALLKLMMNRAGAGFRMRAAWQVALENNSMQRYVESIDHAVRDAIRG